MLLGFHKMQACGNDFVVLNCLEKPLPLSSREIKKLSDRRFSIGFDQMLILEKSKIADFKYRIFNSDGNEVSQCGNGARCFMLFLLREKLLKNLSSKVQVETASQIIELEFINQQNLNANSTEAEVKVNMGTINYDIDKVSLDTQSKNITQTGNNSFSFCPSNTYLRSFNFSIADIGNPHMIIDIKDLYRVKNKDDFFIKNINDYAQDINATEVFKEGVNINFYYEDNSQNYFLRVFERGVGETLACGTGACSSACIIKAQKKLKKDIVINLAGGVLKINEDNSLVTITGSAYFVFSGVIDIKNTK